MQAGARSGRTSSVTRDGAPRTSGTRIVLPGARLSEEELHVPLGGGGTSPRMAPPTLLPRRPLARLAEPHGRHVDNWEEWTIGFGATATADEPTNVAG